MSTVAQPPKQTALALGNPARSAALYKSRSPMGPGDMRMSGWSWGGDQRPPYGWTEFRYREDYKHYGVGFLVRISYSWNKDEAKCYENDILQQQDGFIDIKTFRNEIVPRIKNLLPATFLNIKTVNGSLEITELPVDPLRSTAYPKIPDSLATLLPSVSIYGLRKCELSISYDNIDIVTVHGDPKEVWYIFKRYRIPIEIEDEPTDRLLSEVELLSSIDSPFIIKPSMLVTDDSKDLFRGYLMPLLPAGTLRDVFLDLSFEPQYPDVNEPMLSHPKFIKPFTPSDSSVPEQRQANPQLPWSIKHTWAVEAAHALATLHDNRIYCGDIKLSNILLGRDGHIQFIDVAPVEGWSDGYMPPEINPYHTILPLPRTEARDLYAFGIVLWQIAEEVTKMADWMEEFDITWRLCVPESTPEWYKSLFARCTDVDPAKRPSAREIIGELESHL